MSLGGSDILVGCVNGLLKGFQLSETTGSLCSNLNSVSDQENGKIEVTCLARKSDGAVLIGGADGSVTTFHTDKETPR